MLPLWMQIDMPQAGEERQWTLYIMALALAALFGWLMKITGDRHNDCKADKEKCTQALATCLSTQAAQTSEMREIRTTGADHKRAIEDNRRGIDEILLALREIRDRTRR